ncbi:YgiQ family radical SAM protein [Dehalobacter sp. DCM]|uniref:YgiQ family radical SAM protein n=1 Tax=Dehalobacter sp. DCM TaxID=2907827 RepID=UPI003FCD7C11|nr:YgiQ family radical SAM protein [Dehalobacter sp. DCM]
MEERGWEQVDFVLVSGDAYVDHPSFGHAIISRVLENAGYKVGILPQPDWKQADEFKRFGRPRLGFLVTAGNTDSMVNHYSVNKKLRDKDHYSPGGKMGRRPDRATIVYCNKIREAYRDIPIIIGGVEASLRRFSHYDYWNDAVRKSILIDSSADVLVYGMAEKQIVEIAEYLNNGMEVRYIRHIPGTCYTVDSLEEISDYIQIPSFKGVSEDKIKYAEAFKIQYQEQDPIRGKTLVQQHGTKYLVQNVPEMPLTRTELDAVYALPYVREAHPLYYKEGGIPALEEVKFSIVSSRGCFGSCSFCALTFHQGRIVQSRSEEAILEEAVTITNLRDFKGYIHDVGGPTANFRHPACDRQLKNGACKDKGCLHPAPCNRLRVDHQEYLNLLRKLRRLPKIKKVFVRSGLRYDYIMADKSETFLKELIEHHISGQLKVAPEHISSKVLHTMGKPAGKTFEQFRQKYFKINERLGKKQFIVPYFMSSHPGSTLEAAVELAEYLKDIHYQPEQVQDFYPTPGTLSTAMFYTGLDPLTMKPVYVPKSKKDKAMQRALLQFRDPKKYAIVYAALEEAGRTDLIGYGPKCLIRPKRSYSVKQGESSKAEMAEKTSANKPGGSAKAAKHNGTKMSSKKAIPLYKNDKPNKTDKSNQSNKQDKRGKSSQPNKPNQLNKPNKRKISNKDGAKN